MAREKVASKATEGGSQAGCLATLNEYAYQYDDSSVKEYLNDTIKDTNAIIEGYYSDGKDCYEKFIPEECEKK